MQKQSHGEKHLVTSGFGFDTQPAGRTVPHPKDFWPITELKVAYSRKLMLMSMSTSPPMSPPPLPMP